MSSSDGEILKDEGLALYKRGAYDEAVARFERAAQAFAAAENSHGRAEMLNNLGVLYRMQGKPELAANALEEARSTFASLGALNHQGQVMGNLGDLYAATKKRDEAANSYASSAQYFAEDGDRENQSQVLRALSLLRLRQGRWLEAMLRMHESLQVRPHISLPARLFRSLLRFALGLLTGR
jgi:tetratricopeptide (TPR) repeat protein